MRLLRSMIHDDTADCRWLDGRGSQGKKAKFFRKGQASLACHCRVVLINIISS